MKLKDLQAIIESGVSLKATHKMHGSLIQCDLCQTENIERILNGMNMTIGTDGTAVSQ